MESRGLEGVNDLIQRGYTVKIGDYISQGWQLFKKNAGGYVVFTIILILINIVVTKINESASPLGTVISLVVTGPLTAGWYIVAFKQLRNRLPEFADFFKGLNNFLPFFLLNLISGILIGLGFVLLILPGIYLAVAYMFALPFAVAQRMDFWTAMEASRKLITKNWFSFFGFGLVLFLINLGGALLLGVGLLVTIPLSACAVAAAYADIVGLGPELSAGE
jgi:membrane-anchored glycerophosphoryl diester phosphodiesterase (GDPDase)